MICLYRGRYLSLGVGVYLGWTFRHGSVLPLHLDRKITISSCLHQRNHPVFCAQWSDMPPPARPFSCTSYCFQICKPSPRPKRLRLLHTNPTTPQAPSLFAPESCPQMFIQHCVCTNSSLQMMIRFWGQSTNDDNGSSFVFGHLSGHFKYSCRESM